MRARARDCGAHECQAAVRSLLAAAEVALALAHAPARARGGSLRSIIVISQLEIISPGGESYEQIGSPTLITSLAEDASTPAAAVDPQPPAPVAQPTAAVDSPAGGAADVPMPNAQGCAEANAGAREAAFEPSPEPVPTSEPAAVPRPSVPAPACALVDGIAMPGATVDAADAEPKIEPKAEPTAEPTAEPKVEPKAEPTAEPVTEPVAEPTAEVATGAVAEAAGCAEAGLKLSLIHI